MQELTFKQLLAISYVMPVLLALSVICIASAFERWIYFLRFARVSGRWLDRIRVYVKANKYMEAKREAHHGSGLIAESISAQMDAIDHPRNERESLVLFYHQRLQAMLSRRLWIFGTLSFICPLVGLLGTVLGVIRSFKDLAISGSGGPTIVAAGISEALYTTAGGIGVAIMAAVIYNWFNIWMKQTLQTNDIFGQEMILLTHKKS